MFNDLRHAVRALARNPGFTAGALATLALGIGVNSTIFTLANAALFRALPGISTPDELVWVSSVWRLAGRETGMSYPDFADYRDASAEVFSGMLAFRPVPLSIGGGGEPERVRGQLVTGSYFQMLGVTPAAGRLLVDADDRPAAPDAVAVVSHRLWQRRFGGAADVVQQAIIINGRPVTIVGVAPRGFSGPAIGEGAEIWMPLSLQPQLFATDATLLAERGASWLSVMGRLRPGVDARRAQQLLAPVAARLEQAYPATNSDRTVRVSDASALAPAGRAELLPLAGLLLGVTALVLMIACANVANLLLARGAARAAEIAIRSALGATRRRIVRQLLTESLTLAVAGAGLGLLLSFWAADFLLSMLPPNEFANVRGTADVRVVLYTAVLTALSVCIFGLLPALSSTRRTLLPALRTAGPAGGRSRLQGAFVVGQLSMSLVLLLAAGLSLRALHNAAAIDLGFNAERLITASYDLVLQNYPAERRELFRADLLARVEALPSVVSATIANVPPLSGTMVSSVVTTVSPAAAAGESRAYLNAIGPDYFRTMEIPLVAGRGITAADVHGAPGAAVINETLAARLGTTPSEALGRRLQLDLERVEIVGVARNSKYDEATEDPRPFLYTSIAQRAHLDRETLLVRTAGAPEAMAASVQAQIRALDPAMPVFDLRTMEGVLRERSDKQRGISTMLAAFGVLALGLAAIGLYGVMSYTVTLRRRELGVRLALGASPRELTRLVATEGLRLALAGAAIGAILSLPVAYILGAVIFGVRVGDVAGFAAACALLVTVAVGASLVPAWRASRLDPMAALRTE